MSGAVRFGGKRPPQFSLRRALWWSTTIQKQTLHLGCLRLHGGQQPVVNGHRMISGVIGDGNPVIIEINSVDKHINQRFPIANIIGIALPQLCQEEPDALFGNVGQHLFLLCNLGFQHRLFLFQFCELFRQTLSMGWTVTFCNGVQGIVLPPLVLG